MAEIATKVAIVISIVSERTQRWSYLQLLADRNIPADNKTGTL